MCREKPGNDQEKKLHDQENAVENGKKKHVPG